MIEPKAYITSKKGELSKYCQDAYCFNEDMTRFSVADGATKEFLSAKLAFELVDKFCLDKGDLNKGILLSEEYEEWLKPIQSNWLEYVEKIVHNTNKKANFTIKNRFNRRAAGASTFVGLELDEKSFKTMIIGDSCLFHIRENEILKCYLIDNPDDFDNSPEFFFSRASKEMIPIRTFVEPKVISGDYEIGDYFLLASDAISKYFLTQNKNGKWIDLWKDLLQNDRGWYNDLIDKERINKNLDDDDVTILIVPTTNTTELKSFEDPETYSLGIDSLIELKNTDNIDNTINELAEVSDSQVEDKIEIESKRSVSFESDIKALSETGVIQVEPTDNTINELAEVSDSQVEDKIEIENDSSIVLKSNTKTVLKETPEEAESSEKTIVWLIYDKDIKAGEVNQIRNALKNKDINYRDETDDYKIKNMHGVLISLESRKRSFLSVLSMSEEVITRTYSIFSKEEREKYKWEKKYNLHIKKIGNFHSCDLSEIVELIKKGVK